MVSPLTGAKFKDELGNYLYSQVSSLTRQQNGQGRRTLPRQHGISPLLVLGGAIPTALFKSNHYICKPRSGDEGRRSIELVFVSVTLISAYTDTKGMQEEKGDQAILVCYHYTTAPSKRSRQDSNLDLF
jgi:hypothetical protein